MLLDYKKFYHNNSNWRVLVFTRLKEYRYTLLSFQRSLKYLDKDSFPLSNDDDYENGEKKKGIKGPSRQEKKKRRTKRKRKEHI